MSFFSNLLFRWCPLLYARSVGNVHFSRDGHTVTLRMSVASKIITLLKSALLPTTLRQADHSSRGVLPTVVCRSVWSRNHKNPREWGGSQGQLGGYRAKRKIYYYLPDSNLPKHMHNSIAYSLYQQPGHEVNKFKLH